MYDKEGNITREGAEQVIREGGSVTVSKKVTDKDGNVTVVKQLCSRLDQLPDEADFGSGSPESIAAVRAKLEKDIADAQAKIVKLGPPGSIKDIKATAAGGEGDVPNAGRPARAGKS